MKIMSLNVWGGRIYGPLVTFIAEQAPFTDVFCFQEVFDGVDRVDREQVEAGKRWAGTEVGDILDLHRRLKRLLPNFNSQISEPYSDFGERLGLYCKKTLRLEARGENLLCKPMIQELEGVRAGVGSSMQWIRVRGGITIAHVHGLWVAGTKDDTPERIEQSQNINAILNRMRGEKILIGDFNLNPDTKSIKLLEGNMRNLVREYGITTTRSELSKASKGKFADYAFVSAGVKLRKFSVLSAIVSDHLPLCLEIENPGGHSSRR